MEGKLQKARGFYCSEAEGLHVQKIYDIAKKEQIDSC